CSLDDEREDLMKRSGADDRLAEQLEELASADIGGRRPHGFTGKLLLGIAAGWSLFQLWIASPLPYIAGFGVFNSTEARSIHLCLLCRRQCVSDIAPLATGPGAAEGLVVGAARRLLRRLCLSVLRPAGHAARQSHACGCGGSPDRAGAVAGSHTPSAGPAADES